MPRTDSASADKADKLIFNYVPYVSDRTAG